MNKSNICLIIILISLIYVSPSILAVVCNTTIGTNSCTIPANTTLILENNTYYYNGTLSGAIQIQGDNVTLDCNGSTLIGNGSQIGSFRGIFSSNYNNITIKNCNVENYYINYFIRHAINPSLINLTSKLAINNYYFQNVSLLELNDSISSNSLNDSIYMIISNNNQFNNINFYNNTKGYSINYQDALSSRLTVNNAYFETSNMSRIRSSNFTMLNSIINNTDSSDYRGIYCTNCQYMNITNVTFIGGEKGIYIEQGNYSYIGFSTFINQSNNSIDITSASFISNFPTIINNIFTNISTNNYAINIHGTTKLPIIKNNYFINNFKSIISTTNTTYIANNTITGNKIIGSTGILIYGAYNSIVENNTVELLSYGILVNDLSLSNANDIIRNNIVRYTDRGINLFSSDNATITNNIFYNNTANYDNYDMSLQFYNSKNATITNNNFTQIASAAVWVSTSSNLNFTNNSYSCIPLSQRNNYNAEDLGQPSGVFFITPAYKSFINQNVDNDNNTIINISKSESHNITISDEIFNDNCILLLTSQGGNGNNYNITGSKKISFQAPTYLFNRTDYYVNPNYISIARYQLAEGEINQTLKIAYNSNGKIRFYNKIHKDFIYFIHNNYTNIDYNITIYEQNNALIYNSNGSLYSNSDYLLNDGDINVSIKPKNDIYILNNFNITVGISRDFSLYNTTNGRVSGLKDNLKLYIYGATSFQNVTLNEDATLTDGFATLSLSDNNAFYIS